MMELILVPLAGISLLAASYSDLKRREVPDWLSYSLIISALGVRSIFSVELGWSLLLSGVLGLAAGYLVACLFYYTHQWGGGDSKLLMGMGAVIGIAYPLNFSSLDWLWYLILLLLLGAFYGLFWMLFLAVKNRSQFSQEFREAMGFNRELHRGMWAFSLVVVGFSIFARPFWPLSLIPVGLFYLFSFVNSVERSCFYRKADVKKLTEGDWLEENVFVDGRKILSKKTLEKKDLELLHRHKVKEVLIKEGVPFVPSFLLAYLVLVFGKGLLSGLFF